MDAGGGLLAGGFEPPATGRPTNPLPPPPPPPPPQAPSEIRSATAQAERVVLKNEMEAAGATEGVFMDGFR